MPNPPGTKYATFKAGKQKARITEILFARKKKAAASPAIVFHFLGEWQGNNFVKKKYTISKSGSVAFKRDMGEFFPADTVKTMIQEVLEKGTCRNLMELIGETVHAEVLGTKNSAFPENDFYLTVGEISKVGEATPLSGK